MSDAARELAPQRKPALATLALRWERVGQVDGRQCIGVRERPVTGAENLCRKPWSQRRYTISLTG